MFNPPKAREFFEAVWEIVQQIPAGRVSSYGQIASMIPPEADMDPAQLRRLGARWVGTAMRRTPSGRAIPWHRVINSAGRISFAPGSPQAKEQRRRLEREGVAFDRRGAVNWARYAWHGPESAWLREKNLVPPRKLG